MDDKQVIRLNIIIGFILTIFLVWFIYFKTAAIPTYGFIKQLPLCNAIFNSFSAISVILGIKAILNNNQSRHKKWMLSAILSSTLFLISYLVYHHFHGDTLFPGTGFIRPIYFFILISHIILSIVALPMILITASFALLQKFQSHKNIARWTTPIWLYVSVTGVLIYILLQYYSASY